MENILENLKANFEFVLIGFGSILKWKWILEPSGKWKR